LRKKLALFASLPTDNPVNNPLNQQLSATYQQARPPSFLKTCNAFFMNRTDLSLVLAAFSAMAVVLGSMAALVLVAFLVGWLVRDRRGDGSN
jgi:hypothetical protein